MVDQVKIEGLDELRKTLKRLPKDIRKRELNSALRKGGNIIRDTAQSLVPVGTGLLRDHIAVRTEKKRYLFDAARLKVGVLVKKKKKDDNNPTPWYWRFVEFGTSKQPAQPFLVPAFELAKLPAYAAIVAHLRKRLPKIADRARVK